MRRIILPAILILLLFIIGCGKAEVSEQSEETISIETEEMSFTGSINDLMARATPMKCTWSLSIEGMDSEGTIYVKGKNYRTDITGEGNEFHYISDSNYVYMWSSLQPKGTKISLATLEEMNGEQGNVQTSEMNMDTLEGDYDYKCTPWVVSASKFVPPGNVEFQDFTEMMEQMQQMAENMEAGQMPSQQDMCAMCDSIPDDAARADCLANC